MKWFTSITVLLLMAILGIAVASERADPPAPEGLRAGAGSFSQTLEAPPIAGVTEKRGRMERNYPEQPPVIPHAIRDYQVDQRHNRCLDCHSREAAPGAGAPMVSITHFMDRNKQVLAAVSPDRYFCTQCHVVQTDAEPLVENRFRTVDQVLHDLVREGRQ